MTGKMTRARITKLAGIYLFLVYSFLNSGAFVFHTHPWQHVVSRATLFNHQVDHDCPLCDWGQQNLPTSPAPHGFTMSWEAVSALQPAAPVCPQPVTLSPHSARAPPPA